MLRLLERRRELKTLKERFEPKYEVASTGCWNWTACRQSDGYGMISVGKTMLLAHRMSYLLYKGALGDKQVLHTCDNPTCVNPEHLFLGTHKENMRDKEDKGRGNRTPVKGEAHGRSILTEQQVLSIREDTRVQSMISKEYHVSQSQISRIKLRKKWGHL